MKKVNPYIKYLSQQEDKRAVLLNSGGLDSCVMAYLLCSLGYETHHVFINYGQNQLERERAMALNIYTQTTLQGAVSTFNECTLDLPWMKEATVCCKGGIVTDSEADGELNTIEAGTYVPMRNTMFLTVASSLAESLKISTIVAGLDGLEDRKGKPLGGTTDKHPTFIRKVQEAITEGSALHHVSNKDFVIVTPIMGMYKDEIIKLGMEVGANFSLSWSCYSDTDKPCGQCSACRVRAEAFESLGLEDPCISK